MSKPKVYRKDKPVLSLPPKPEPAPPSGHYEYWKGTRKIPWYASWRETSADEFHFHVKAANGEIIAVSESYARKEDVLRAIAILQGSADFDVKDITVHG